MTAEAEFRQAMEAKGVTPPETILADGTIHRFATNGRPDDKTGWYVFHEDGIPAGAFGCWRSDINETWSARSVMAMTESEREAYRQRLEAMRSAREEESQQRQATAAAEAKRICRLTQHAPDDHPYLKRKQIRLLGGPLVNREGALIIPLRDIDGQLWSLQFITPDGEKRFLHGGRVLGCFQLLGGFLIRPDGSYENPLCIAEGYATAVSIHEATGYPVAVAFHAGNLRSVAQAIRVKHPQVQIILCGDNDKSGIGQVKAREAAEAVGARFVIPNEVGMDWNDVAVKQGLEVVREAVLKAENSFRAPRPGPLHESHFAPIRASVLLMETPEPTDWLFEEFLASGSLALLAGKPKEGKTTLTYELACCVAQGRPFLGRMTRQGGVLILAVEEHRRDVQMRLHALGAATLENLYLYVGPLSPTPTLFVEMGKFIEAQGVRLVIIDTLAAFWLVENENDASEMTRAVKPLLQLARESGACVLLVHHARKSEGSHGDEIRGSGALFGLVDVALVMKRHSVENQRLLQAQSRYPETPSELVLELRESGYVALGDPASVGKAAKLEKLVSVLPESWEEAEPITKRAGLTRRDGYRLLGLLVGQGKALRDGKGKKSDPFVFQRNSIRATPPVLGTETNPENTDSIRATPYPPARNESNGKQICGSCGGLKFWKSVNDVIVCSRCHPPASAIHVKSLE